MKKKVLFEMLFSNMIKYPKIFKNKNTINIYAAKPIKTKIGNGFILGGSLTKPQHHKLELDKY